MPLPSILRKVDPARKFRATCSVCALTSDHQFMNADVLALRDAQVLVEEALMGWLDVRDRHRTTPRPCTRPRAFSTDPFARVRRGLGLRRRR